ncbi:MAG: Acetolactate synthase isozyme 1 large subunit [Spirochaetes bacterium ADurb.Bin269]|nr:MAG: Acetolactate synthase isozyme 1 large subunit [Spirochaetes bacterium ADurb.Bin269]
MIEATGAQIVVKLLERQGITTVAGIPGGSILPLYDELTRSPIRHVLVRHEQAGGFIAQGMARSTGETAVCLATSGPGAMNLLTAIADARSDSVPLVAITGQVNTYLIGTDAFQEADTFGLSFPITKHSVMAKSAAELLEVIPRAFEIAASGRPGPVLVDIPRDIQLQKVQFEAWPEPAKSRKAAVGKFMTGRELFAETLSKAAELLLASNRPVLYAGGGSNSPEAAAGIRKLLEALPMPVVTSLMGIGCVPTADPLMLGMVGMHGSIAANRAMHDADVVIAAGARFDDRATGVIREFCPDAKIVHIDIDAAEVNKILPALLPVVGDVESALPFLAACILERQSAAQTPGGLAIQHSCALAAAKRLEWQESLAMLRSRSAASDPVRTEGRPGWIISSLSERARAACRSSGLSSGDMIVATDVGQHQMWTAQYFPFTGPRQFLTSGSLGTMGFGLPTAIGASLAHPEKRVLCISGDGSIMMNIQELATLAELALDVTVFILDNGALGMVRQQQELIFSKNYSASIFERSPDLVRIAEGFGIVASDTESPGWEQIAFGGRGPRVIRHRVAMEENVFPFVPAGKANVDAMTAR